MLRRISKSFGGSAAILLSGTAAAQITNPPVLQDARTPVAKPVTTALAMAQPLDGNSQPPRGDRLLDLTIVYTDSQLYNPTTGLYDKVHLRSYTGKGVDPKAPFVSPTIEAIPGDTVRVLLNNQLPQGAQPGDPGCTAKGVMPDTPHCFNGTNLHTHGLWVNPAGNGDNVLLSINPQTKFTYEYNIPSDHPSGTFWYHTHRHGSTALQVSSGMAGALIIRGSRLPSMSAHGDIDTLIPTTAIPERVLVMQQIQYACRGPAPKPGELGKIKVDQKTGHWICDPGDVGGIESYDQFGPGSWPASGRYTSLNGKVFNPDDPMKATQGQIERWRMIHAGVRDTIGLQFVPVRQGRLKTGSKVPKDAKTGAKFIKESCGGTPVPYTLIAADGLTMDQAQTTSLATFQPGYRFDALVVFPEAGRYCVLDTQAPKSGVVNALDVGTQLLAVVDVAPGTAVKDVKSYVTDKLVSLADQTMPGEVKAAVVEDLKAGMRLRRFTPHPDITDAEVAGNGTQELTFFIDTSTPDTKFEVGNTLQTKDVRPYDPNRIDRKLPLGKAQEWTMQSHFVSHPFHIHVNPFQIVSILDPNGKDVSAPGAVDDAGGSPPDPQYAGLKGVWKDTLWIKSLLPNSNLPAGFSGLYTIKVRTRYERYIGEFVLHCHILDHEDQGMMQNVAVVLPDQVGSTDAATGAGGMHHGH
ncbi:multicopper oxidase family protein [Sphingomonas elodea]|uniref:multicopper oxidase family protein n=1 Tax=Sphingomonas elodea TaxID=179878 RepID=UPI000313CC59|nr:multicopper oxidase domain-containing protein [Sphingomonas elodea]